MQGCAQLRSVLGGGGMRVCGWMCVWENAESVIYILQRTHPLLPMCSPHPTPPTAPQMLATADEETVARVLQPTIAANMRSRSSAASTAYAAATLGARAAAALVRSARQHVLDQARQQAVLAAGMEETTAAAPAAAKAGRSPPPLQQQQHEVTAGAGAGAGEEQQQLEEGSGGGSDSGDSSDESIPVVQPGAAFSMVPAAALAWNQGVIRCEWVWVVGWGESSVAQVTVFVCLGVGRWGIAILARTCWPARHPCLQSDGTAAQY